MAGDGRRGRGKGDEGNAGFTRGEDCGVTGIDA